MSEQDRTGDLPWNDAPADDDLPGGVEEPAPAEVVGDEDDPAIRDEATPTVPDPAQKYVQETLDQRLSEEEPDRVNAVSTDGAGELVDPRVGGGDVQRAERDQADGTAPVEELAAEDAAMHVVDEDRVLGGANDRP
jgi:hypothetical protein